MSSFVELCGSRVYSGVDAQQTHTQTQRTIDEREREREEQNVSERVAS